MKIIHFFYKPIILIFIFIGMKEVLYNVLAAEICNEHIYLTDLTFTCCRNKSYTPGINLLEIDKCIPSAEDKKSPVISVTWNIYNCLVRDALKNKALNLSNFANMMAQNQHFPAEIINSIIEAVDEIETGKKKSVSRNDDSPVGKLLAEYKDLIAIKTAYYEIEKKVCEETPKTNKTYKIYDAFEKCLPWVESNYNLGDCCNGYPVPMPLYMDPYIPTKEVTNYTHQNIIPIVGKFIGNEDHTRSLMLCYRIARHLMLRNPKFTIESLKEEVQSFNPPDYEEIADAIIPKYYSTSLKEEIKEYLINDLNLNNTEFVHLQREEEYYLPKKEFAAYPNSNITMYLFWHCAAYQVMSRKMKEYEINEWCGN